MGGFEMILLDTHIWVWWVNNSIDLSPKYKKIIEDNIETGLALSVISIWELLNLLKKRDLFLIFL